MGTTTYFDRDMDEAGIIEAIGVLDRDAQLLPAAARAEPHWLHVLVLQTFARNITAMAKPCDELDTTINDAVSAGAPLISTKQLASMLATRLDKIPRGGPGNIHAMQFSKGPCLICGGPHFHKSCGKSCNECSLDICRGARGESCILTCADADLPNPIVNALGKPLPDHLQKKLLDARVARQASTRPGQVAVTLTRPTDHGDSDAPPNLGRLTF